VCVRMWVLRFPISVNYFKQNWKGHSKILGSYLGLLINSMNSKLLLKKGRFLSIGLIPNESYE